MSSAAVGLLTAALLARDALALHSVLKILMLLGLFAFGIAAAACLSAFMQSSHALERQLEGQPLGDLEAKLKGLESWQRYGFLAGVGLLVASAVLQHVVSS
jgi:hypothetical protein